MTFCFALATPYISLVAADTRVNLTVDGNSLFHDGPDDCTVNVTTRNYDLVIPFKYRKIRRAGHGWVTFSGDYILGRKILDTLNQNNSDDFDQSNKFLINDLPSFKSAIQKQTGFSELQLCDTVVLGSPFRGDKVWVISLNQSRAETNSMAGSYLASWPPEISDDAKSKAVATFEQEFKIAYLEKNILNIIRSITKLVCVAAKYSNTVGIFTQIGLTIASPSSTKNSFYIQDNTLNILSMTDEELSSSLSKVS